LTRSQAVTGIADRTASQQYAIVAR